MLERADELAALDACLTQAADGSGCALLITGPAGIGKSRLLDEAVVIATRSGFRVLRARGSELERAFAFGLVRQLFEPVFVRLDPAGRAALLAGAAGLCETVIAGFPEPGDPRDAELAWRRLHGLYWLCANLIADRPLLLALDDLQWADGSSLGFIAYLAARIDTLPVAVVVAARSGELDAVPGLSELHPQPLSDRGVAVLARRAFGGRTPSPAFASACRRATGGIPFLLGELLRTLAGEGREPTGEDVGEVGPEAVARFIERRLALLPDTAARLCAALAILGGHAELSQSARLAGLDAPDALNALDALLAAGILETRAGVRFAHPIVQAAVYAHLPRAAVDAGHRAAAGLLDADGRPADEVSAHLMRVEPREDAWVARTLFAAAEDAAGRGAPEAAAALLRRALREPPPPELRDEVRFALGMAQVRLGDPEGIEHLMAALGEISDLHRRGAGTVELMLALGINGRMEESVAVAVRAIDVVAPLDREAALALESVLGATAKLIADPPPLPPRWARYGPITGATAGERMLLGEMAWERAMHGAPADEVSALARQAIADGAATVLLSYGAQPQFFQAAYLIAIADHFDEDATVLQEGLAASRTAGSLALTATAEHWLADLSLRRGRIRDAEAHATTAGELCELIGWEEAGWSARAALAQALVERGDLDAAERALGRYAQGELPAGLVWNLVRDGRVVLRLAQGRPAEALDDLFIQRDRDGRAANPAACPWRSRAALALQALGRDEEASALAEEEVALARVFGAPRALGVALRVAGLVAADRGRLEDAVAVLRGSGAEVEYARALVDLGAALRRAGRRTDARGPLSEGLERAVACGATSLADRAHAELLAAGARPRRLSFHGADSLTASERRVATMAADGLGNVAIAQALFVSRKTVETHLGHVYAKLGIGSRDGLSILREGAAKDR